MSDPVIAAQISVAALQDVLFALAVGSLACDASVVAPHGQSRELILERRLASVRLASLLALAAAHSVYLWLQAAAMAGLPLIEARAGLTAVVTQSHFGGVWLIALCGLVLALLNGARLGVAGRAAVILGLAVYAAGRVGASHAAADAGNFTVPEFVHWLHLCATAWWAGSVVLAVPVSRVIAAAARERESRHFLSCATRLSA
jgi:putative copper resistance protein D